MNDANPAAAPSTRRSKRVRESTAEAAAAVPLSAALSAAASSATVVSSSARSSKQARTAAALSVQPTAPTSGKKKGPGRRSRAELSKAGEPEAEVAAAVATSPASSSKRKSAASAKFAAATSAAAASSSSTRPSLFSRLDADSLGIALSFLDANEFHIARLVSKQWHAASAKRTAWPQLQVDEFIRLMQNDAYDDPSRRRLVDDSEEKLKSFVQRFSAHPSADVFGKHASEVKLSIKSSKAVRKSQQELLPSVLPILTAQFQFLSALTLDGCDLDEEAVKQLYTALAPRLRVLILSNCSQTVYRRVSLLTGLRVHVADRVAPAESFRPLVSLVYLHIMIPASSYWARSSYDANHNRVLRWLAANHALRSLSFDPEKPVWNKTRMNELIAVTDADANRMRAYEPALPAPIVLDPSLDFTVPARLTDLSIGDLVEAFFGWDHLPDLRRVEVKHPLGWQTSMFGSVCWFGRDPYQALMAGVRQMLSRLTEIRVLCRFNEYYQSLSVEQPFEELRDCTSLRRLTFTTNLIDEERTGKRADPVALTPLLHSFSSTIEELRLGVEVLIAFKADPDSADPIPVLYSAWSSLANCRQLRVLELSFSALIPDSFLRALSSLPVFRSLELSFRGNLPHVPPTLLRRMFESPSWSALHLHSVGHPEPRRFDPLQPRSQDGLAAQLTNLQRDTTQIITRKIADRTRLYVHLANQLRARTYRIVTDDSSGGRVWESDE